MSPALDTALSSAFALGWALLALGLAWMWLMGWDRA